MAQETLPAAGTPVDVNSVTDFSLRNFEALRATLGANSVDDLKQTLAKMKEAEIELWLKKVAFNRDTPAFRVAVFRIKKELDENQSHSGGAEAAVGTGLVLGGALAVTVESARRRFEQMMKGDSITYFTNLDIQELSAALQSSVSNSDIKMQASVNDDDATFKFILEGKQLLEVHVINSKEKAPDNLQPHDDLDSNEVGKCEVIISGLNTKSSIQEALTGITGAISAMQKIRSGDGGGALDAGMNAAEDLNDSIDAASLPNKVSSLIDKLAKEAEALEKKRLEDIKEKNRDRYELVSLMISCGNCGKQRGESDSLCQSCGAVLKPIEGTLQQRIDELGMLEGLIH